MCRRSGQCPTSAHVVAFTSRVIPSRRHRVRQRRFPNRLSSPGLCDLRVCYLTAYCCDGISFPQFSYVPSSADDVVERHWLCLELLSFKSRLRPGVQLLRLSSTGRPQSPPADTLPPLPQPLRPRAPRSHNCRFVRLAEGEVRGVRSSLQPFRCSTTQAWAHGVLLFASPDDCSEARRYQVPLSAASFCLLYPLSCQSALNQARLS